MSNGNSASSSASASASASALSKPKPKSRRSKAALPRLPIPLREVPIGAFFVPLEDGPLGSGLLGYGANLFEVGLHAELLDADALDALIEFDMHGNPEEDRGSKKDRDSEEDRGSEKDRDSEEDKRDKHAAYGTAEVMQRVAWDPALAARKRQGDRRAGARLSVHILPSEEAVRLAEASRMYAVVNLERGRLDILPETDGNLRVLLVKARPATVEILPNSLQSWVLNPGFVIGLNKGEIAELESLRLVQEGMKA